MVLPNMFWREHNCCLDNESYGGGWDGWQLYKATLTPETAWVSWATRATNTHWLRLGYEKIVFRLNIESS